MKTRTIVAVLGMAAAVAVSGRAQESQEPPAEKWQGGSAAQGQVLYKHYCRVCHGNAGKGDGVIAEDLRTRPTNLTALSRKNKGEFPTERVVRIIDGREAMRGHGRSDMPAWGDIFQKKDPDELAVKQRISDIVEHLRSIQESAG